MYMVGLVDISVRWIGQGKRDLGGSEKAHVAGLRGADQRAQILMMDVMNQHGTWHYRVLTCQPGARYFSLIKLRSSQCVVYSTTVPR